MKSKLIIFNVVLVTSLFCACFYLAWQISAATNFLYSTWYEVLDIDSTILTYAPKNKNNKYNFEKLSKTEHERLFADIVSAIQKGGNELENIKYKNSQNNATIRLLTKSEVIHLQDVANLVSAIKSMGLAGIVLYFFAIFYMYYTKLNLARYRSILFTAVSLIIVAVIVIMLIGPTKVFYWGHEVVFPENNQWFFYYEDSLMSTMMKAPALFGPIAGQLLFCTLILWMLFMFLSKRLLSSAK